MELISAIVLALVQGITEFLPISSSAHLILVPRFLGWPDQGLSFDVAVHLGTLTAVVFYFRKELMAMWLAWKGSLTGNRQSNADARLAWAVIIATIPAGIAGLLFKDLVEVSLRSPMVIAISTAVFGVALWVADLRKDTTFDEHHVSWKAALIIGAAQALALIPGTSRSGITITAGLALGMSRATAARFSFLMAVPIIALASLLVLVELFQSPGEIAWTFLATGLVISAVSAYLCIKVFLSLLDRVTMLPFMLYRLALSAVIIWAFA